MATTTNSPGVIWERSKLPLVIDFCSGCDRILFNDPLCRFDRCDDCRTAHTNHVLDNQ